jgi:predicted choloylglycine hydrolase
VQLAIRISSARGSHDKDFVNLNFNCTGFSRRVLRAADDKDFVNPEALAIYRFANLNICDVALITPSSNERSSVIVLNFDYDPSQQCFWSSILFQS